MKIMTLTLILLSKKGFLDPFGSVIASLLGQPTTFERVITKKPTVILEEHVSLGDTTPRSSNTVRKCTLLSTFYQMIQEVFS